MKPTRTANRHIVEKCILNLEMDGVVFVNSWVKSRFARQESGGRPPVVWRTNPSPGAQRTLLSLLCLFLLSGLTQAAATEWKINPEGQVRLITSEDAVPKTGSLLLGLHFKTAPGWYVYWKMAGDAGYPPSVKWQESEGIKDPHILWPQPTKFILPGQIMEYGYEGEVVYPIRVQLHPTGERVRIAATLSYLTCNTSCVPYKYTFRLDLPVGETKIDLEKRNLIERFLAQVPPAGQTDEAIMRLAKVREKHMEEKAATAAPPASLPWILLLAFVGGVILNVMPCVLPVLSIKLLGLLQHSGQARGDIIRHALASAAGILASFVTLALAATAARNAGHAIGWGIQFQEPLFVGFLALVIFLFALNLWGTFEVGLPHVFGQFASTFGRGETMSSYFVSGLFATLLATPCSAPFLGTAMGFALSQPPSIILAIFSAVGAGMALPYFVLAAFPKSLHWLPKPGAWMIHLRTVLGFFLAATVVWLGFVLSSQIQPAGMAYFYLSLVGIAFAAWLRELLITHPKLGSAWIRRVTALGLLLLIVGTLKVIDHFRLAGTVHEEPTTGGALTWIPFDEAHVQRLLADGKTIFVDVTADWCVTCKYNERFVLQDPEVVQALTRRGVIMMRADWTNRDQAITSYLTEHGRAGIPFYAFYLPGRDPVLLSEFLTKKQVLNVLVAGDAVH